MLLRKTFYYYYTDQFCTAQEKWKGGGVFKVNPLLSELGATSAQRVAGCSEQSPRETKLSSLACASQLGLRSGSFAEPVAEV